MRTNSKKKLITAIALSATMLVPAITMAKVSGQCGDCHTMHNSQDGAPMTGTQFGLSDGAAGPANGSLLRYGCIGCHTGTNTATTTVPFVLDTALPTGATLAGGNFYWVAQDTQATDNTGHNVLDIAALDRNFTNPLLPPGSATALGSQLTCASTTGCHGVQTVTDEFGSIAGGHHDAGGSLLSNDSTKRYVPGTAGDMANSYRMLDGIEGIEDLDWEYTVSQTDHNQYAGATSSASASNTISALCANCHGDFHTGAGTSSPWVRHPTDFDMGSATGSEYAAYNGATDPALAPYSFIAPVASNATGSMTDVLSTVNVTQGSGDGSAIVTCVSCHRPHGSENADLLRWDYTTDMLAHTGVGNQGCFICHTTKDDI